MKLSFRSTAAGYANSPSPPSTVSQFLGVVAIGGALMYAIVVGRYIAAHTILVDESITTVLLGDPVELVLLPAVLIGGWFAVGALLLAARPGARAMAAGAFAGAASVNAFLLVAPIRWPTLFVDPFSPLFAGVEIALTGFPTGNLLEPIAWSGTLVAGLAAVYLTILAVRTIGQADASTDN